MLASLRVITPSAAPAVDIEIAARHARIDSDSERDLFEFYVASATSIVEKYLGRALINQTLRWTVSQTTGNSGWPNSYAPLTVAPLAYDWTLRRAGRNAIELPYSPVQSVTSVITREWDGAENTLDPATDYTLDLVTEPARLHLDAAFSWGTYNHLSVTYVAGYGADYTAIPKPIVNAVMMVALNLYENRGENADGGLTRAVTALLTPYRIVTYAG